MLNRNSLPDATRLVFEQLAQHPLLQGYTLIGGTALALQINHRRSEDLDFWLYAKQLNKEHISQIIRDMQQAGFHAMLATPHHQIISAKINGDDLLSRVQDYVIGGVKVTFLARADMVFQQFNTQPRICDEQLSFHLMSEQGLFMMKSHLIHQRVRSRDLYDLKTFITRGKTLAEILQTAQLIDPSCSSEYAKSVLLGEVPLDKEDEGFDSIALDETIADIFAFFAKQVDSLEQQIAMQVVKNS